MFKKIMSTLLVLLLFITMTGCSGDNEDTKTDSTDSGKEDANEKSDTERPFTESQGSIKFMTIEGDKVAIPETVGEYVKYLEKIGSVELGDTGKSVTDAADMEANGIASLTSYLHVNTSENSYQWFGIHYKNPSSKKIPVSKAVIDRIILSYDIYAEEGMEEYQQIDTIILHTDNGEIAIDGKTTSADIMKILGAPQQNTDGYLRYADNSGYTYKFATENKKGILTQVQIDYPKK